MKKKSENPKPGVERVEIAPSELDTPQEFLSHWPTGDEQEAFCLQHATMADAWDACQNPVWLLDMAMKQNPHLQPQRYARTACRILRETPGAWDLLADPRSRRLVEMVEEWITAKHEMWNRFIEWAADDAGRELRRAAYMNRKPDDLLVTEEWMRVTVADFACIAASCINNRSDLQEFLEADDQMTRFGGVDQEPLQARIIREEFGNPFRALYI